MPRHLVRTSLLLAALAGAVSLPARAGDAPAKPAAPTHAPHWDYIGHDGPAHWAELDPAFEACASGRRQSPIDIRATEKAALPALDFHYGRAAPTLVNNGHTVQVNLPAGQTLTLGGTTYQLLQFHFHTPSEETIRGRHAAMVAHFVHKAADGSLGVVGVLIQPGKPTPAFDALFQHLPRAGETITVAGLELDLPGLLPAAKGYYDFDGSLTTPPCSEGVHWMVLKTPVTLSRRQIDSFHQVFPMNARPVQSSNGRVVKESI